MSEHEEFLPPSDRPLTKENLKINELILETENLPTPPPVPPVSKNIENEMIPISFKEHKEEVFEQSQRLLNEVHESEKLVIETDFSLKGDSNSETDVIQDLITLSDLVALLIAQDDKMKQYHLHITHEAKIILSKLLSVDSFLDEVEEIMNDIVHDNKIDVKDVPKIMLLLTELYKMLKHIEGLKFNEKLCGEVVKVLFNIALKEKLIPVAEQDIELLKCLYEIVDTSIVLMQTDVKGEKKGIFYHLKKCFNSCKQ